jgi:hypothetical protein
VVVIVPDCAFELESTTDITTAATTDANINRPSKANEILVQVQQFASPPPQRARLVRKIESRFSCKVRFSYLLSRVDLT